MNLVVSFLEHSVYIDGLIVQLKHSGYGSHQVR